MAKPSLKDQLNAQRTANASTQNTPVQSTFRQDEGAEPRVRTSMYLPESLARELRVRAANEGIRQYHRRRRFSVIPPRHYSALAY